MKHFFNVMILIALALGVFEPQRTRACTSPSLALYELVYPNQGWINPDSTMVDTCSTSATHGELFASHWFLAKIDTTDILDLSDTDGVSWQMINPSYPTVRSGFQALEAKFRFENAKARRIIC